MINPISMILNSIIYEVHLTKLERFPNIEHPSKKFEAAPTKLMYLPHNSLKYKNHNESFDIE